MKRSWLSAGPLAVGALLAVAACTTILGDFEVTREEDDDDDASGGAGATSTGGGGSGAASPGGGGQGGAGLGGPCGLGEPGVCGAGHKCSVVDVDTGATGCVPAGPHGRWSVCAVDTDCEELTWCDGYTGICRPLCTDGSDCMGDGRCVSALRELGVLIPGLLICTADCHPLSTVPCDSAYGTVSCGLYNPGDNNLAFECFKSGNGGIDASCTGQTETSSQTTCGPGLVCLIFQGDGMCKPWCSPPGEQAQCPVSTTCQQIASGLQHQGVEYGGCF